MKREVLLYQHPLVRSATRQVTSMSNDQWAVVDEMKETLDQCADSMRGLAANQIGFPCSILAVRSEDGLTFMANPVIKESEGVATINVGGDYREGCYSIPGVFGHVERPAKLVVEAIFLDPTCQRAVEGVRTFTGLEAVVVGHKKDHLQGILYPQRMNAEDVLFVLDKNRYGTPITVCRTVADQLKLMGY